MIIMEETQARMLQRAWKGECPVRASSDSAMTSVGAFGFCRRLRANSIVCLANEDGETFWEHGARLRDPFRFY